MITSGGVVSSIAMPGSSSPSGLALYDHQLFVAENSLSSVAVVDADPGGGTYATILSTITGVDHPIDLAVAAGSGAILAANSMAGTVTVIDGDTDAVVSTSAALSGAMLVRGVDVDETNRLLYVSDVIGGTVYVMDAADVETASPVTSVALSASAPSVAPGGSVTYTAIVAPPNTPGTVLFRDGATPVTGCTAQPITVGVATCSVTYSTAGAHSVTARTAARTFLYAASAASPAAPVIVGTGGGGGSTTTAPAAPTITGTSGDGQVIVSFTAPADGGAAISGYQYSSDGGSSWHTLSVVSAGSVLTGTVTGLSDGTAYQVQVRAVNSAGNGTASNTLSLTPSGTSTELTLSVPNLTDLRVGDAVDTRFQASGGTAPYSYSVDAGHLPTGLDLNAATGRLSGTPTVSDVSTFQIMATDSASTPATGVVALLANVRQKTASALPPISRSTQVKIPTDPKKYHGATKLTTAYRASYNGTDAYPATRMKNVDLIKGEASTLSGDGLFRFDSATLTSYGQAQVKIITGSLRAEAAKVTCEGYTDYAGARSHELTLSAQRAKAVCATLRTDRAGVTVASVGYGPRHPAVVGGTATSRKENRRVVVYVTK